MRHRLFLFAVLVTAPIVAYACSDSSESGSAADAGGTGTSTTTSPTATATGTTTTTTTTPTTTPDATAPKSALIINEVSPTKEWVELVNAGDTAFDLTGWLVADTDKDGGGPKTIEYGRFDGGSLAPKTYAVVQGKDKPCPDGGQAICINAAFGLSKDGESVFLVQPDGGLAEKETFPADAGESWSRIPNADPKGAFKSTTMSPGAANIAP